MSISNRAYSHKSHSSQAYHRTHNHRHSCCREVRFCLSILPFRFVPGVEIISLYWFHYSKVVAWQSEKNLLCSLVVRRATRISNPRVIAFRLCPISQGLSREHSASRPTKLSLCVLIRK